MQLPLPVRSLLGVVSFPTAALANNNNNSGANWETISLIEVGFPSRPVTSFEERDWRFGNVPKVVVEEVADKEKRR